MSHHWSTTITLKPRFCFRLACPRLCPLTWSLLLTSAHHLLVLFSRTQTPVRMCQQRLDQPHLQRVSSIMSPPGTCPQWTLAPVRLLGRPMRQKWRLQLSAGWLNVTNPWAWILRGQKRWRWDVMSAYCWKLHQIEVLFLHKSSWRAASQLFRQVSAYWSLYDRRTEFSWEPVDKRFQNMDLCLPISWF